MLIAECGEARGQRARCIWERRADPPSLRQATHRQLFLICTHATISSTTGTGIEGWNAAHHRERKGWPGWERAGTGNDTERETHRDPTGAACRRDERCCG